MCSTKAGLGYEECCQEILRIEPRTALQRDINGLMPIHYAIMAGHASLIGLFFDFHETTTRKEDMSVRDVKLIDFSGYSMLHFACYNGHSTCVETICELGETHNYLVEMLTRPALVSSLYNGFSPLHCACYNSHSACVAYLLDKYESVVDLVDNDANTCLHVCASSNELECATLLVEAGCDLNVANGLGRTPLMVAAAHNSFGIVELLLKRCPMPIKAGNNLNLNSTVEIRRAALDLFDSDGNSALHLALTNKNENCALFLLDEIKEDSSIINAQNKKGDFFNSSYHHLIFIIYRLSDIFRILFSFSNTLHIALFLYFQIGNI